MKTIIREVIEKEVEIKTPCYRVKKLDNGEPFCYYKITEEKGVIGFQQIMRYRGAFEYSSSGEGAAFADGTEEVDEQRWAEWLVKLSVQINNELKEYSI